MDVDLVAVAILGNAGGVVTTLTVAYMASQNRDRPGALSFGVLALVGSVWCVVSIAQLLAATPDAAAAAHVVDRIVAAQVVALWLVFALIYTGRREWIRPGRLAAVFLASNGYVLLLLTAPIHGLVEPTVLPVAQRGVTLFTVQRGAIYAVQSAVSYALLVFGYVLLVEFLFEARNVYRKQTAAIVAGAGLPLAVSIAHSTGLTLHPGLDFTPIAFSLNTALVGWALFEDDSLSVTQLSGDGLVDDLPDPVIALNDERVVVDFNAAAASVLDHPNAVGNTIDDVAPGLVEQIDRGEVFTFGEPFTYYNPRTTEITDQFGEERGCLIVLRDVTGQQRRQERLEALQSATQQFIGAETAESIAEMSVEFATAVLDQNAAGVFLEHDNRLEPTVVSEAVDEQVDDDLLTASPDDQPDSALWVTYERGEARTVSLEGDGVGALRAALMLPLGSHGVLAIGTTDDGELATEDRRYAEVLAQTTQVALDQVERERELRQSRGSVKRRREQIEFFNGVLRHSLHNAMVVIRGRAEHVRDDVPPSKRRHLDSIVTWCGRLTDMSETIRDINNTVTASEAERLEVVDLDATIRRSVRTLRSEYEHPSIECELSGDHYVQANKLLEEVLLSILRNAVEHNDADTPSVTVSVQEASDWLQVRIADDGPGISDELKATVFERGLTPDQTAGGFGIYFVSVMMELYNGTLWFEDNEPTGTVAVLEFQQASTAQFEAVNRAQNASDDGIETGR
ncbi:sensor histidine kinase [Haloarcula salina]|uniref:ATP-binding protein n=1 Tax=Haloarcula salina TaxID=1429914 RepID=A0AA41FZN0_9EURY|nr:histidine kinase N-terminal 7TM domain-containing protein [Haloarcula salina]MBV0900618.1 ATP-binding protein [Haloarcula salina]